MYESALDALNRRARAKSLRGLGEGDPTGESGTVIQRADSGEGGGMFYPGEQGSPSTQVVAEGGEGGGIFYTQAAPTLVQQVEAKTPSAFDIAPNYTIPGTTTVLPLPVVNPAGGGFTNNFAWPSQDSGVASRERIYSRYFDPIKDKVQGLTPPDYFALQLMRENPNPSGWASAFNNIPGIEIQVLERYLNQPVLVEARNGQMVNLVNSPQGQAIIAAGQNAAVQHHANVTRMNDEGFIWQEMPALSIALPYFGAAFPGLIPTPGELFRNAVNYEGVSAVDEFADFSSFADDVSNFSTDASGISFDNLGPIAFETEYFPDFPTAEPTPEYYPDFPTGEAAPEYYPDFPTGETAPEYYPDFPTAETGAAQMPPAVDPEANPEKVFNEPEPPVSVRFPEISTSDLGRAFNFLRQLYAENQGAFRQGLTFLNQSLAAEGKPAVPAATILQQRPAQNISVTARGGGTGNYKKPGLSIDAVSDTLSQYALPIGAALFLALALAISRRRR